MKFTVSRETFLTQLSVVARGASTRSAIQTLAGVLIRLEDGHAELHATDTDLGIRAELDAQIGVEGSVVVPGRLLLDVARSLPQDSVSVEYRASKQDVEVVSGSATFHLRTLPLEDFPKLPQPDASTALSVPAPAFIETVGRVARSASRDETRPHLTGVLVTAEDDQLRMVATDSYRLSVKETKLDQPLAGTLEANVPARTLQELSRIAAANGAETIDVTALENQVVFSVDDVVLSSRLVEGRFPNYQQLLPDSYEHELRVERGELLDVVRRISLLAQKNAPLRMAFTEGARGLCADSGCGRGARISPGSVQGRTAGDRLQPGVLPRRAGERGDRGARAQADQPAAPGPDPVGRRRGFIYLVMPIRLNV